jgi:hypothetical protein
MINTSMYVCMYVRCYIQLIDTKKTLYLNDRMVQPILYADFVVGPLNSQIPMAPKREGICCPYEQPVLYTQMRPT